MRYVIAGAGPAGIIAAETLRKTDPQGEVVVIGGEDEPPYSRMAIPYFLEKKVPEQGTHLRLEPQHYEQAGIQYLRNRQLTSIDPAAKKVTLSDGGTLDYDRLLLATGSRPVQPPIPGLDSPGVTPCWTLQHARAIDGQISEGSRVVLIGAGFIGTIVLDAIAGRKAQLTVVETQTHMVPRMMNLTGGELIKKWCESKGVRVLTSASVERVEPGAGQPLRVHLAGGEVLDADLVITATGVAPNMEVAAAAGIATGQGILVNQHLQTNFPEIYAAGDVAEGLDFSLGEGKSVHAIQPTAAEHGQVSALNMAGVETPYRGSLSMNVVETIGLPHYTFGQWMGVAGGDHAERMDEEHFQYLRLEFQRDVLVGAINIGHFEHVGVLRGLIQSRIPFGEWKQKVVAHPRKLMEAYLALTGQGRRPPHMTATAR